ncbi:hypothetical protein ACTWPB_07390 [Nocardia sp. IBHARD005]|uniref:hypothetical protein n=1 Tax=Nocardia sp. IBHARD005 TaxID=3457765 RepID=UPI004059DE4A
MSAADKHRRDAVNYLSRAYGADPEQATLLAAMANAGALLAIEARLGELVEATAPVTVQRIVNTIGDTMTGSPYSEGGA